MHKTIKENEFHSSLCFFFLNMDWEILLIVKDTLKIQNSICPICYFLFVFFPDGFGLIYEINSMQGNSILTSGSY
jgi:hypothetical protein